MEDWSGQLVLLTKSSGTGPLFIQITSEIADEATYYEIEAIDVDALTEISTDRCDSS